MKDAVERVRIVLEVEREQRAVDDEEDVQAQQDEGEAARRHGTSVTQMGRPTADCGTLGA
jgi:hypothetical protein